RATVVPAFWKLEGDAAGIDGLRAGARSGKEVARCFGDGEGWSGKEIGQCEQEGAGNGEKSSGVAGASEDHAGPSDVWAADGGRAAGERAGQRTGGSVFVWGHGAGAGICGGEGSDGVSGLRGVAGGSSGSMAEGERRDRAIQPKFFEP